MEVSEVVIHEFADQIGDVVVGLSHGMDNQLFIDFDGERKVKTPLALGGI